MSGSGPTPAQPEQPLAGAGSPTVGTAPPAVPAADRAARFNAMNMVRSLLPLLVIILLIVGWFAWQQNGVDPVRTVDPSSTVQLAASRAAYPFVAPAGLPRSYRPTSARTDAGRARQGDPVTLQLGYVTPSGQFAGLVETDDPRAGPLTAVLGGAQQRGTVDVGGTTWTRSTTTRGETALSLTSGPRIVVVSGSAGAAELERLAGALRPYSA